MEDNGSVLANSIVLNGKNCKVGSLIYVGTCKNNSLPLDLFIRSSYTDDPQDISFSVGNLDQGDYNVSWRINRGVESRAVDNELKLKIDFPGTILAEALVSDENGFFRIVKKVINVGPGVVREKQIRIFQFINNDSTATKLNGTINSVPFELTRSEGGSNLFWATIDLANEGNNSISIPELGYQANFVYHKLPDLTNPAAFIDEKIDDVDEMLNDSLSTQALGSSELVYSIKNVLSETKEKIDLLSYEEKVEFAKILQANLVNYTDATVFNRYKVFNILDLLIPTANAEVVYNHLFDAEVILELKKVITSHGAGIVEGASLVLAGGATFVNSKAPLVRLAGGVMVVAGLTRFVNAAKVIYDVLPKIYKPVSGQEIVIVSDSSRSPRIFKVIGRFAQIDEVLDASHGSELIRNAVKNIQEINLKIKQMNFILNNLSNSKLIGYASSFVGRLEPLHFPSGEFLSSLNPAYIKEVKVLSYTGSGVSIKSQELAAEAINIVFNAAQTQNAKVRVVYANRELGINTSIDTDIKIEVRPFVISYETGNRDIRFSIVTPPDVDMSSYSFKWFFGDTKELVTTDLVTTHRYSETKNYSARVEIYDQNFNLVATPEAEVTSIRDAEVLSVNAVYPTKISTLYEYLLPTTTKGFSYEYTFDFFGTCYAHGITYISNGGYVLFYNCSYYNLIP